MTVAMAQGKRGYWAASSGGTSLHETDARMGLTPCTCRVFELNGFALCWFTMYFLSQC